MFLTRKRNKKSVKDLSHVKCTTLAPGNLVPISTVRIVSGDDVIFDPSTFVQAMPMKAPLVNGYRVCYDYFFVPDRLYNIDLQLNMPDVTDNPFEADFPVITEEVSGSLSLDTLNGVSGYRLDPLDDASEYMNFAQSIVQAGSLADYMGIPVGYTPTHRGTKDRTHSALVPLGYWDIFLNYYANQQESKFPTAFFRDFKYDDRTGGYTLSSGESFELELSDLADFIRFVKVSTAPGSCIMNYLSGFSGSDPEALLSSIGSWSFVASRRSIFQRCQRPYFLEAWLKTSGYDSALQTIQVDTDSKGNQSISMRNVSKTSHLQRWMDLALAGGSRYSDYLSAQFDVPRLDNDSRPIFLGSDRKFLGSNVVYQTTGAGDASSPLGSFAGQSSGGEKFKTRKYHFNENGTFFVIASLVPDTIYYRGIDPFLSDKTLGDFYTPALDNIGMEPLPVRYLDAIPSAASTQVTNGAGKVIHSLFLSEVPDDLAVGYVPAWSKYDQVVSRAHGRMATELKYWLLAREYAPFETFTGLSSIMDDISRLDSQNHLISPTSLEALSAFIYSLRQQSRYSSYILGNQYNDVFADTSRTAQNFVLTFSCDMKVSRERGKVNVPTTL